MKILIIEDDEFFRKFYTSKLTEAGFEVDWAADGEEGLQKLRQTIPNLILLDMIMPKKDGFDVLSELSKDANLRSIPVVVLSVLGQEVDVEKAKMLGAKDFVNKSLFDFSVVLTKINALIEKA